MADAGRAVQPPTPEGAEHKGADHRASWAVAHLGAWRRSLSSSKCSGAPRVPAVSCASRRPRLSRFRRTVGYGPFDQPDSSRLADLAAPWPLRSSRRSVAAEFLLRRASLRPAGGRICASVPRWRDLRRHSCPGVCYTGQHATDLGDTFDSGADRCVQLFGSLALR